MKILFLTDKPPWPSDSGSSYGAWNIIKSLALAGHSVTLLTAETVKHKASVPFPADLTGSISLGKTVKLDTEISIPAMLWNLLTSSAPYTTERFRNSSFGNALRQFSEKDCDAVIFEGLNTALYLDSLSSAFRGLRIYRPQNVENIIWHSLASSEKNPFKRIYLRIIAKRTETLEKEIMNSFDCLFPVSPQDNDWFRRAGLEKPSAIMLPSIALPSEKYSRPKPGRDIAFIGSLDWMPNKEGLKWFCRDVWPRVHKEVPGSLFHIAGKNPSGVETWLKNIEGVVFHGEVKSSAEFLSGKALLVSPLFSGSGIRIKILEAMAMGLPVVATPVAASGIEGFSVGLAVAGNPQAFAEEICKLLLDTDLNTAAGEEASSFVRKNYNILAPARVFDDLITSLSNDC